MEIIQKFNRKSTLNAKLQKQIRKYFGSSENIPAGLALLMEEISDTYDTFENDSLQLNKELKLLFDNVDALMFSVDIGNNVITQMQQTCEIIYGRTPAEFKENVFLWLEVIIEEDKVIAEEQLRKLDLGEKVHNQYRIRHKDGSIRWLENKVTPTLDKNGKLVRVDGITLDITESKRMENILQKSEADLRNILENSDTAYVLLDKEANILSFNKLATKLAYDEMLGGLTVGKSYIDLMPVYRKTEVKNTIDSVIQSGKPVSYEITYEEADNKPPTWLAVRMHPIINSLGEILGLSIAASNITERKLSERLFQKSAANLRTIFDNTDVSYVLIDRNFNIVSYNQRALQGYQKEFGYELVEGLNLISILPDYRKEIVKQRYTKVLGGDKLKYETSFPQPDGTTAWYDMNVFPVQDTTGKILGLIIATEDITDRKLGELEKEKMTADILQRNSALEQFAYIISHNLRSPVANIIGLSNIILGSPDFSKKEFDRCMEGLALSVKKLDDVIIDLNYILQVRRSIIEKKEEVHFSDIINDIKTSISGQIEKEKVSIKTDFSQQDTFFALKSYINSILFNLISNSIKYRNPQVTPQIEIRTEVTDKKLVVRYSDNGLGIDMETNGNKVFGLYKKFHSHAEGKGMGLYMVKTQVEILGGKISVKSAVNKGTEFVIEFEQ